MAFQNKHMLMAMAVLAVAISTITTLADAQNVPSCASKLVPCFKFINNSTAKPDSECCNSIKNAVEKELPCLCTVYFTPGLLATFNVSVDAALNLTQNCNVPNKLSTCKNSGASSPTSSVPPPGNNENGAMGRVAWTGITSSLLLFWAAAASFML